MRLPLLAAATVLLAACAGPVREAPVEPFDVLVRNGSVHDGTGGPARRVDIGIRGDRVAAVAEWRRQLVAAHAEAGPVAITPPVA